MLVTPDKILIDLAKVFRAKNKIYKDNYKRSFGRILQTLFPHGLLLETEHEFTRFAMLLQIVHKLTRYSPNFKDGGHGDSMTDLPVYAAMLKELDNEKSKDNRIRCRNNRTQKRKR